MFSIYQVLAVVSAATTIFSFIAACDKHEEMARENDIKMVQAVRKILIEDKEIRDGSSTALVKKENY